jgi:hypothetical protein
VYDKIHLIRDPSKRCEDLDPVKNPTLGEVHFPSFLMACLIREG